MITTTIFVSRQGPDHFQLMLDWLANNADRENYQWFGYYAGSIKDHSIFHFYNDEVATVFKLVWNGKSKI